MMVKNHQPVRRSIIIIDVASDKAIPSLVKNPTTLISVTPTPPGKNDK